MSKIFKSIVLLGISASLLVGCKKEDLGPAAVNLDPSSISTEAKEGAIVIKWNVPDNANYNYIEVKYRIPGTTKDRVRLASVHSSSIEIDNLFKRYGTIEYSLTPVTKKGARGTTHKVSAECLALPSVTTIVPNSSTELTLTADDNNMWTDSHQTNDGGGLPAVIDKDPATFWHMKWSPAAAFPHYLVVKLPEPVRGIGFYWRGRNNANRNNPTVLNVYGLENPFTGAMHNQATSVFQGAIAGLKIQKTVSGMPTAQAAEYTSEGIILDKPYQYICFEVTQGNNSTQWIALAEWKMFKHKLQVFDPETGKTTPLE